MVICQNQDNPSSYLYYCCFVNHVDMNMFLSLIIDLFAIFCFVYLYWRTLLSNFVTFPKIYLATFIQKKKKKKIALLIVSRIKGQQMVFSKNWKLWIYHLLQYITGKYFLHWFLEKSIRNSNYRIFLYKAVIYQQNGIIDLVNSKFTTVCAIMTCFINYDIINLYDVMSYILISKRFVSG